MTEQRPPESLWSDFEPGLFVSEQDVPSRASDLAGTIDEWFTDYVAYVDPFNWDELETEAFRKKGFLELSGYLLNARGVAGDKPLPEIHELIIDRVNDRRFAHLLLRSPRELHHFALPFVYTYYVDEVEPTTATRLEKTIDVGAFWEVERVPYRQIEYCFLSNCFSHLFGYSQDIYDEKTALEDSLLNHQPNVVRCTLSDAYCLTHDVFFYNNHLGIFPEAFPDEPAPYEIGDLLEGLILRYMAADNCDIVLELLLSGVLQRQVSRQMVRLVLSWILEKVEDRGYVPGPKANKEALKSFPDGDAFLDEDDVEGDKWDYATRREAIWGENFHVNAVAGMTARIIARDWNKLDGRPRNHGMEKRAKRRETVRLGQLLKSLADYDLQTGARQLTVLADSPVVTEYESVVRDAVRFLKDQRTLEGEFGYWTNEEILYTNAGHPPGSFSRELVAPITEACQDALDAIETARDS